PRRHNGPGRHGPTRPRSGATRPSPPPSRHRNCAPSRDCRFHARLELLPSAVPLTEAQSHRPGSWPAPTGRSRRNGSVCRSVTGGSMPTGTVKWFNTEKGYGFIAPDEGDRDLFVHQTGVDPSSSIKEGDQV